MVQLQRRSFCTTSRQFAVVTIPIQLEWKRGSVVSETTTEYKEINDDSDFANFGTGGSVGELSAQFPSLANFGAAPTKKTEAASSSSSSDEEEDESKFAEEALKVHNQFRDKHGVKPLKMDKELTKHAQEWADKLAKEDRGLEHRNSPKFGENLYCTWSSNPKAKCPGSKPVESWYNEMSQYTFGSEPTSTVAGHFTQVVWKDSKKLGIAKARSKGGKVIVVANYEPPGNWIGQYRDNVLPPKK